MRNGRHIRLIVVAVLVCVGLLWTHLTTQTDAKVTLLVTAVVAAVTIVYALFTYEILEQNQHMSKAALESASLMEKSLRYSSSAHVTFSTLAVKATDVEVPKAKVAPVRNEDFLRALTVATSDPDQSEFIFAIVENSGPGVATELSVEATYAITDSSNLNKDTIVKKTANIPTLAAGSGIALCIFMAKVPTPDDGVRLIEATVSYGDFYKDAISESQQSVQIKPERHRVESAKSTLRIH